MRRWMRGAAATTAATPTIGTAQSHAGTLLAAALDAVGSNRALHDGTYAAPLWPAGSGLAIASQGPS